MANLSNINNKFLVTTGGNVGINVTSPTAARLVVNTASGVTAAFGRDGTDGDVVQVYNGLAGTTKVIALSASGNDGTIYSQYGNIILQPTAGNVGIGTSSPGTLHGASYGTTRLHVDGGTDRGQMIIEGDSFAGIVLSDNGATANQRVFATSVDDTKYTIKPLNDNGTSTAGGVAVTVLHSGNVGIGITGPTAKLQVAGTTTYNSDTVQALRVCDAADVSKGIHIGFDTTVNAGIIQAGDFGVSYRDLSLNPNVGNVGIGTTSPGTKLDVLGDIRSSTRYLIATGTANQNMAIGYWDSANARIEAGSAYPMLITSYQGNIKLGISGSTTMTIQSSNVGIGTTNPLEKLNVAITTATAGTFFPLAISGARYQADYGVGIAFRPENNSGAYSNKTAIVGSGGGYGYNMADLHFCFNNDTAIGTEVSLADAKVTMKRSGRVGIGTVNPGKTLEVAGSYKLGTNAYIQYDASYPYTITTANTAGVGNLVFSAGLGSAAFESKIELQGSNTAGAAGITLSTASNPRITITSDGKIGLRKTDPYYDVDATEIGANSYAWGSGLAIFGQDRYNIRELNNLFYSADTRCGGIGSSSNLYANLFNGNFDSGHTIAANTTQVVEIDGTGIMNMTYPQGYAVISFYYVYNNYTSLVGEQYHWTGTYAGQWRTMGAATSIRGSAGSGGRVVRLESAGNNYVSKWRFTFVTGSSVINITDIAYYTSRDAGAPVNTYMRGDRTTEWTRTINFRNNANGIIGSIVPGNTSTAFNTTSDYRLKEDLKDFIGLDMISKIPVYSFKWINKDKRSHGVLAHELEKVLPQAVTGQKDAKETQVVDYSKIVPLLIKAIQELKAEIDELKK